MRNILQGFVVVATTAAMVGCGPESGSTDSSSAQVFQEKRVTPTDDESLGRLVVSPSSGWTLPTDPNQDAMISFMPDNGTRANLAFGTAYRTVESSGCLSVSSKFGRNTSTCGLQIRKATTTTLALGSLKVAYDRSPTGLLSVDFGPKPGLKIWHIPGGSPAGAPGGSLYDETENGSASYRDFWNGRNSRGALAAPGTYSFSFGLPIIPAVEEVLAQGEDATITLGTADLRSTLVINPPVRELPDAVVGGCQTKERTFLLQRNIANDGAYGEPHPYEQKIYAGNAAAYPDGYNSGYDGTAFATFRPLAVATTTTMKVFPFPVTEANKHYELVLNNVAMKLDLNPGQTTTVQLERLDIDDVNVRREDGTVYKARGTYKLWRQGPNNSWVPLAKRRATYSDCSGAANGTEQLVFPTNTGVDVFAGTYRLVLEYTTGEGPRQQDFTVSVP
jgi:hypothetical protein